MRVVPEGQLAFGMQLPIQAQSEMFVADWERTAGPDELIAIVNKADETGFFYVGVCDHVAIPRDRAPAMGTTWYDTIATLGMIAGCTTRVHLLSHVWVAPYRHPLLSAKAFATLDHLSKGRLIIGVGAGHVENEFAMLGVEFHRRGALLDEAIDAIDVALRDEPATFTGPTWSFQDAGIGPRPVQRPRPPIWVGGSTPAAIKRAALKGDGWLPQGTPRREMPAQMAELRRHRESAGITEPIDIGTICETCYVGTPGWDVGHGIISGDADRIAGSFNEFGAMGVNQIQVRFKVRSCEELLDQMEAFGSEVAPLLKESA